MSFGTTFLTSLSHCYAVPFEDSKGTLRVFIYTPNKRPALCKFENWPADSESQDILIGEWKLKVATDSRDYHLLGLDRPIHANGLTVEEAEFALGTKYQRSAESVIPEHLLSQWSREDEESEMLEQRQQEQRQVIQELRQLSRRSANLSRLGYPQLAAQLNSAVNLYDRNPNDFVLDIPQAQQLALQCESVLNECGPRSTFN